MGFGGYALEIQKKVIKHIYLRIYPSRKVIVVSAPFNLSENRVNQVILSKKSWIERQIRLAGYRALEPANSFVTGERIQFKGQSCFFEEVYQQEQSIVYMPDENTIVLNIKPGCEDDQKRKKVANWLRTQLRHNIQAVVDKWQPIMGVDVKECRVRKMKTRWGSCNVMVKRIWVNQALVHLLPCFLEYVVVHEMVHLLERKHNQRFYGFMDQFIPDWRRLKKELNRFHL
ncbi:MAG: SprT family zinc-dependent metalloprotease [Pseudomonadota bacterium]